MDLKFPTGCLRTPGLSLDSIYTLVKSLGGDPFTDYLDTPTPVESLGGDPEGHLGTPVSLGPLRSGPLGGRTLRLDPLRVPDLRLCTPGDAPTTVRFDTPVTTDLRTEGGVTHVFHPVSQFLIKVQNSK